MDMNRNKSFEFGSLNLRKIFSRNIDQGIKQRQEALVGLLHDLLVNFGIIQSFFCISRPNHLNAKNANLKGMKYRFMRWSISWNGSQSESEAM